MSGCCVGPFLASLPSTLSIYKPCSDNQHPERDGVAQIWKLNVSIPKPDSKPDQFPIILHWLCRQHITGNCYDIIISTMSQSHDGKWICESLLSRLSQRRDTGSGRCCTSHHALYGMTQDIHFVNFHTSLAMSSALSLTNCSFSIARSMEISSSRSAINLKCCVFRLVPLFISRKPALIPFNSLSKYCSGVISGHFSTVESRFTSSITARQYLKHSTWDPPSPLQHVSTISRSMRLSENHLELRFQEKGPWTRSGYMSEWSKAHLFMPLVQCPVATGP